MTRLTAHRVFDDEDTTRCIATVHPASKKIVKMILQTKEDDWDGRSQFVWINLPNGDLILGVYPQGDTYCACEKDAVFPG